jgi:RNA polymerase sigma-70 factor (ECF subfamily)
MPDAFEWRCQVNRSAGFFGATERGLARRHKKPRNTASASHGGVEMRAADLAGHVDSHGDPQAPAQRNVAVTTLDHFAWDAGAEQHHHGGHAVERDQNHRAEEFGDPFRHQGSIHGPSNSITLFRPCYHNRRINVEPTSSYEWSEKGKAGEQEAFSRLFDKYRRRLAVLVHFRISKELRGSLEVDDVLQETFLRAFRDIGRFEYRSPGSMLRWLISIADHVILDAARAKRRLRRDGEEVPFRSASNPAGPEPADSLTPSRILAQNEAVELLLQRLNELPEDYRRVILMAKIEGLSSQEMAEQFGRPREAVALLLHRAVKRFRELAKPDAARSPR